MKTLLLFLLPSCFFFPERLVISAIASLRMPALDDLAILLEPFGQQLGKYILLDVNLIRIRKHIPVIKVLVVRIKPQEEGLEEFVVAEKNFQDIFLVINVFFWSSGRYLLPNAKVEAGRQQFIDHQV